MIFAEGVTFNQAKMQTQAIPYSIGLSMAGLWLIGMGLWLTLGINRTWWQWRILPFQEGYFWAGIPAGVALILLALTAILPLMSTIQEIFFWVSMGFVLVAIIFSIKPPKILKPKWLSNLEDRYPGYVKQLRNRARELSSEEWRKIVYDPILLEQWADDEIRNL